MAVIRGERTTRRQEKAGRTRAPGRRPAAGRLAALERTPRNPFAAGNVAVFFDGHHPITRQVARGVIDFLHAGRCGTQAGGARSSTPWSVVLGDDLGGETPSARNGFVGVIGCLGDQRLAAAVRVGGLPAVGVACCCEPQPVRSLGMSAQVVLDEERIAALAAEHLVACGLRTLAYVTTGREREERGRAFERYAKAAQRSCHVERLTGDPADMITSVNPVISARERTAKPDEAKVRQLCRWLESQEVPVGVLACDDHHARLVIDACRRVGRRVPHDVAVIGVGNDDLFCESASPPLSSIDPGFFQLGAVAAATLDAILRPRRGRVGQGCAVGSGRGCVKVGPIGAVARRSTDMLVIDDEQVARAVRIVRGRPAADLTVESLAAELGLSRSTLEQRFRRALGCSVHDEMVRTRLTEVRRIIGDPGLTTRQVAEACGFASVSYMTTFIKKHLGVTPGRLRGLRRGDRETPWEIPRIG